MTELKVLKLHPLAKLPEYATAGAACFDIHALESGEVPPQDTAIFSTGLAVEIPAGWAMLIYSRSGHGFKNDVRLANCVGIIDSDYRGEIKVKLSNDHGFRFFSVKAGERIAQAMLVPAPRVKIIDAKKLSETERGQGGFGSTGQ